MQKNLRIKGILVDTRKGITPHQIEYYSYKDISEAIGCKWIACVSRCIGGKIVDVYCDEEALLKPSREPAIITRDRTTKKIVEVLYGNCFLCIHDSKGNTKSLPRSYYDPILLAQAYVKEGNRGFQVLQAEM